METSAAQPLRSQLDQRQRALDAAAAGIDEALARDDWSAAAAHLVAARQEGLRGAAIDERIGRLRQMLLARIAESFAAGRLDTAQIILEHLTSVDADSPHVQPWKKALAQCRRAAQAVQEGQPGRAAQTLRRLRTAMPEVPWLAGEIEHCEQAAAALDHLATGALGLLDWASGTGFGPVAVLRESSDLPECKATCGGQHGLEDDMSLPERLLIRVDGVGSFLVLRGQRVTLGPISSSARPDIAFLIDPSTPPVAIERAEEDYFLVTGGAAGGAVSRRLLTDGDKIDLSGRCRLRFSRPNAASTSALLELTAGRLGQSDTRKIILMDREILLGAGAAAHIRAEDLAEQAVLLVRDGRLACQTGQPVLINGKMAACPAALPLATPVRIGPVSLIVEQA
jgi:hypothetical protein